MSSEYGVLKVLDVAKCIPLLSGTPQYTSVSKHVLPKAICVVLRNDTRCAYYSAQA